jgi:hypothetical protein
MPPGCWHQGVLLVVEDTLACLIAYRWSKCKWFVLFIDLLGEEARRSKRCERKRDVRSFQHFATTYAHCSRRMKDENIPESILFCVFLCRDYTVLYIITYYSEYVVRKGFVMAYKQVLSK